MIFALALSVLMQADTVVEPPPDPFWAGSLDHRSEWITGADFERQTTRLRLGRRIGRGSIALDIARIDDFGGTAAAFGAETYLPLWHHAEGYFRIATAPGSPSAPDLLLGAELLQHFGNGSSLGGGGWYRGYDHASLQQIHASGAHRWTHWDLRARAGVIRSPDDFLPLAHVIGRRFLGSAGSYVELVLAAREEVLDFIPREAGQTGILTTPIWQTTLRGQVAIDPSLSILLAGGYSEMNEYGARVIGEVGVAVRW